MDIFAYEGIMTGMYVWYSQFSTELWHYRMSSIKKYHFFRISFAFLSHFFRITISAEVRVMANLSYPVSSKKNNFVGYCIPQHANNNFNYVYPSPVFTESWLAKVESFVGCMPNFSGWHTKVLPKYSLVFPVEVSIIHLHGVVFKFGIPKSKGLSIDHHVPPCNCRKIQESHSVETNYILLMST